MSNITLSKMGGQCLVVGGIIPFIPFLME